MGRGGGCRKSAMSYGESRALSSSTSEGVSQKKPHSSTTVTVEGNMGGRE